MRAGAGPRPRRTITAASNGSGPPAGCSAVPSRTWSGTPLLMKAGEGCACFRSSRSRSPTSMGTCSQGCSLVQDLNSLIGLIAVVLVIAYGLRPGKAADAALPRRLRAAGALCLDRAVCADGSGLERHLLSMETLAGAEPDARSIRALQRSGDRHPARPCGRTDRVSIGLTRPAYAARHRAPRGEPAVRRLTLVRTAAGSLRGSGPHHVLLLRGRARRFGCRRGHAAGAARGALGGGLEAGR